MNIQMWTEMVDVGGVPLGSEEWMDKLEKMIGETLTPQKRGPKASGRDGK